MCGKSTSIYHLCNTCRKNYFSTDNLLSVPRCINCGKELISTKTQCLQCREKTVMLHTDSVIPLFSYRLWNKELMFLWKQMEIRSLSYFFADILAKVLRKLEIIYIVPVPPRPGKKKEKGWDQIEELTTILKYKYGYKIYSVLQRNTEKQQKKLNRESRLQTIGKAYSIKKNRNISADIQNIIPERVCIIDDVTTTGATLECCAELLKKMGVKRVDAVTLFIVD